MIKRLGQLALGFLFVLPLGEVHAEGLRFDAIRIPVSGGGDSRSLELEAIMVRPDDGREHPLAVINHGSTDDADGRSAMSPYSFWPQAVVFARRGWVAVAAMRRGYGASQGKWADGYGSCADPNYAHAGWAGAIDIAAIARYMRSQPYVSKGKWISVGHSAGAFETLALAADAPHGLVAAIAFAPGRGSAAPGEVCDERQLVATFADYGRTSRVPVLWVATQNDHSFDLRLESLLTDAFTKAGGNVTFVKTAAFGEDGHQLFTTASGIPMWSPIVDRFLAANNLVLRDRPIVVARPNVAAPSGLSNSGREAFKTYLENGPNKAFAISNTSRVGWAAGRRTVDEARKAAMDHCMSDASAKCRVVNVNNRPAQ